MSLLIRQALLPIGQSVHNFLLASCPLGPATAHGVGILTELYVIYMERYISHHLAQYEGPRSNGSTFLRL